MEPANWARGGHPRTAHYAKMSSKGRIEQTRFELQISISGAEIREEPAGGVRFCVAPQKPTKNSEKLRFWSEMFANCSTNFRFRFSASCGPGRLKLGQLTDLDVPDSFFRSDRGQRDEKTSKTLRERPSDGSVVQDYRRQPCGPHLCLRIPNRTSREACWAQGSEVSWIC